MNVQARGGFEALKKFKEYKTKVESLLSRKIKILQSDGGGEYMDLRFQDYMIEHEIRFQLSAPDTPQQNGVSERRNRTLLDMIHSMMNYAQLPSSFWGVVDDSGPSSRVDETTTSGQSHPSQLLRMPRCNGRIVSQPNCYLDLIETQVVIPDDDVED
ncbi:gag/pol protein [Cucumis melo var. makuwa]|uniref:Gag/pol protein n=1 Tax=Cucumis melo var. makuwa TaxID=1194695 RepID=A0A5A7UZP7_CUCMM|nr:gag/pol protein [Cucumis melo var. makuwa]TYK28683.1 gag/pol protein [Cucumis melo var. makuwa]